MDIKIKNIIINTVIFILFIACVLMLYTKASYSESIDDGKNQNIEIYEQNQIKKDILDKDSNFHSNEHVDDNNDNSLKQINQNYIAPNMNAVKSMETGTGGVVTNVGSAGLNLRDKPNIKEGNVLFVMPDNSLIKILAELNINGTLWYNVEFNGQVGWAAADYIKINRDDDVGGNVTPDNEENLSQNEREKIIWKFLKSKGLSDYAIAGIMGNLYAESELNPKNVENSFEFKHGYNDNSYTEAVDNGTYKNFVNDGAGYGLAQWTYHTFKQELLNRAIAGRVSISNLKLQLDFLWDWILQNYSAYTEIKNSNSVRNASDIFLTRYERPYDQSESVKLQRGKYANYYFNKYSLNSTDSNKKQTGWVNIDGDEYYFYSDGNMARNTFIAGGQDYWYYLDINGKLAKDEFFTAYDGNLYYANEIGRVIKKSRWLNMNGNEYYVYSGGNIARNTFIAGGQDYSYYLDRDGKLAKDEFFTAYDGNLYYANEIGRVIKKSRWLNMNGNEYYVYSGGNIARNTFIAGGQDYSYYLDRDGELAKDKIFTAYDGNLYYANKIGRVIKKTGWLRYNGHDYYIYNNGSLIRNRIVQFTENGYYSFDAEGKVVVGKVNYFGVTYTTDENGLFTVIKKGIDVSIWQGDIDWRKVKNSGIDFAMLRIGYGDNYKDACFEKNYYAAKKAGIRIGGYYYSYAVTVEEAINEANRCIEFLNGRDMDLPVAFDLEDPIQQNLSKNLKSQIVRAFCEKIKAAGYRPMLYANLNWLNNHIDYDMIRDYDIWLAQWNDKPTYDRPFYMWQFSNQGRIDGIKGDVDLNIIY